jgi:predicted peptidase
MGRFVWCVWLLCLGAVLHVRAATLTPGVFYSRVYTNSAGTKLNYNLLVPKKYDPSQKYPVVVYFHAATTSPTDDLGQLVFVSDQNQLKNPSIFVGPYNKDNGDASYFLGVFDETAELLEALQGQLSIDPDRLYVTGASLGGSLSWLFIARHPGLFAAAITVSGEQFYRIIGSR